jgi:predicted RNA-binding protein (virulence factor B family)
MMKQNMPPLGRVSTLTVERLDQQGAWLMSIPEPLLLPQAELVPSVVAGERVRVFVYRGDEGKVLATRRLPQAEVGSFAALRIKEIQPAGVIFDLGRGFDLPVAIEEIPFRPRSGERTLVRVELDEDEMLCGSCRIADFLSVAQGLRVGQQVDLQVWRQTDLGIKMIIEGRCEGLLYADDAPNVQVGQHLVGYISRLR